MATRFVLLIIAVSLVGCIGSSSVVCGDRVCPTGFACAPDGMRCALPSQLEACAGAADGADCEYPNAPAGMCFGGVCVASRCGNSVTEDGEACDDGNTRAGDGCSSDCRSTEGCGNGSIDSSRGELCDDGNTIDGDGCQADCTLPLCGDGVTDAGELCDDGNRIDGDGCNALCSSHETCGNGVVDAGASEQCDDGNSVAGDTCQPNCQVPRCGDGLTDPSRGEACDKGTANSDLADAFCRVNCLLGRCGDGITDSNEVCDDGNAVASDGCRPDCLSNETCGNNEIDVLAGELCDDGSERSHDGCDNTCKLEIATWTAEVAGPPPSRDEPAMAYDAGRGVVVMFGGAPSGQHISDTWEFDGARWSRRLTQRSPSPRSGAALAYDAARGTLVLFGGSADGALDDTWEYDGDNWTPRGPATVPPARYDHAMAYDAKRKRIVMFGGLSPTSAASSETWEWDGTNWLPRQSVDAPSGRASHAMAFDPVAGTVMLFGGTTTTGNAAVFDTWEWNGTNWINKAPATTPGGGQNSNALAFDVAGGKMILAIRDNTYEWTGTNWQSVSTSFSGSYAHWMVYSERRGKLVRFDPYLTGLKEWSEWTGVTWSTFTIWPQPKALTARMAFDAQSGVLVLFGTDVDGETWLRGGTGAWYQGGSTGPSARADFAVTYDAARDRIVLFGGTSASNAQLDETWLFDGSTWSKATPSTVPPARANAALAYDAVRQEVVMFGGQVGSAYAAETWVWNGTTWMLRLASPPSALVARTGAAMAFDAARGEVVLHGGSSSSGHRGDTWVWNGTTWTQKGPSTVPGARAGHSMTFDSTRNKIVMYGFNDARSDSGLWEWDGTNWTQRTELGPTRPGAAIAYDSSRGTSVLFGGAIDDTWSWNGTTWTLEIPATGPPRARPVVAYDAGRGITLMHAGGETWQWDGNSHWTYKLLTTAQPASLEALVYDSGRGKLVGFRESRTGAVSQTWEWDGTSWEKKSPASSPVTRTSAALAYDAARGKVVLFGGFNGSIVSSETWVWDGTNWMQLTTTTIPPARRWHAMAYDPVRQKVVMFGGFSTTGQYLRDTWEWNGTDWTNVTPAASPYARFYHAMVWHAALGRVLVFGGDSPFDALYDTWAWNGQSWTEVFTTPPTTFGPLAYDAAREQLVMQGDPSWITTNASTTWRLRYQSSTAEQSCTTQPGSDPDGDTLVGTCAATDFDPDCLAWCDPLCDIAGTCTSTRPRCGDGACNAVLESYRSCPADCTAPAAQCGNLFCDPGETATACPGDC